MTQTNPNRCTIIAMAKGKSKTTRKSYSFLCECKKCKRRVRKLKKAQMRLNLYGGVGRGRKVFLTPAHFVDFDPNNIPVVSNKERG